MQLIPQRVRIFLFVTFFLLLMFSIIISCKLSSSNTATTTGKIETVSATPTPTPEPVNLVVKIVSTSVYGVQENILTDRNGKTLYYSKKDSWHKVSCTGESCSYAWTPLLFDGKGPVIASTKLPGKLMTDETVNGNQVAYNGHYLYTSTSDMTPGSIQGQGRNDQWYIVTPDLQ